MPFVETNPEYWFLSTRWNSQTNLNLFTPGNSVQVLVDGKDYMKSLYEQIQLTQKGDYILHAGWELRLEQKLDPSSSENTSVVTVLEQARQKLVNVRVMLSNHLLHNNNAPAHDVLSLPHPNLTRCILDGRFPLYGSAHQKFTIICINSVLHAYCGGIDLTLDRYDIPRHPRPSERQVNRYPAGWHDVHCHLCGPACGDLYETFRERWNDRRRPSRLDAAPPTIDYPVPKTKETGTHFVQVLRTYGCNGGFPFAPKGEFSARAAWLHAINKAQEIIYIEDQYFVSYEIALALANALKSQPQLRVIVLVPEQPEDRPNEFRYHQERVISLLQRTAEDRFATYHLRSENGPIYVHAKLMIVDDVWVGIGSMNLNRRSMTNDSELCIGIVDSQLVDGVCKFARELRMRLWSEHLLIDPEDLGKIMDPAAGFKVWQERAKSEQGNAKMHSAGLPRENAYWSIIDPDGTCDRSVAP